MLEPVKKIRKRRDAWTEKEIYTLKQLYPNTSVEDIARTLGRTPSAVQVRAAVLHLKKEHSKDVWTEKEIVLLKELFPEATNDIIADRMGRSIDAVKSIAKRLGLKKASHWSPKELEYVRKHYSEQGRHYIARKLGRSPDAVKVVAGKLSVSRKTHQNSWSPTEEEKLKQLAANKTPDEIAIIFGRSVASIKAKIYRFGLQPS